MLGASISTIAQDSGCEERGGEGCQRGWVRGWGVRESGGGLVEVDKVWVQLRVLVWVWVWVWVWV